MLIERLILKQIFKQPGDVEDKLRELGLTESLLLGAVAKGLFAWLDCTANHPPSFPGMAAWGETNCNLRESLLPQGWERLNDRNLPLTVKRDTGIAITASSGDECTGLEESIPRTRNPKGLTTKEAILSNRAQLGLFEDMDVVPIDVVNAVSEWTTWLLLSYRDISARVVRSELSRPVNIGIDGRVDGWAERIILKSIPFDGDQVSLEHDGDEYSELGNGSEENGTDAIQVEIKRRV